jgi:hypothetical protein
MQFDATILSITTLNVATFRIMTQHKGLFMTLSITTPPLCYLLHLIYCFLKVKNAECHYAECCSAECHVRTVHNLRANGVMAIPLMTKFTN